MYPINIFDINLRPLRFSESLYHSQVRFLTNGELVAEGILNEGLIKTYPLIETIRIIKRMFGMYIIYTRYADGQIYVYIYNNDNLSKELKEKFDRLGWFCSVETVPVAGIKCLTFEAKFQNDYTIETIPQNFYYKELIHVTPSYNKEKILKNGFSPRCGSVMFDYPGRVYFFPYLVDENSLDGFICQLWNKHHNKERITDYTAFKVDPNKFGDAKLQFDKNLLIKTYDGNEVYSVFTTENIRPDAIIDSYNININDLMNKHGLTEKDLNSMMSFVNLLKQPKKK